MIALSVNNLSKNYGFGTLFENLSFAINEGERLAILGQNGSGKSALLKILCGKENYQSGSVNIKNDSKIGYLSQTITDNSDKRIVLDIFKSAFEKLNDDEQKLKQLEEEMNNCYDENKLNKLVEKYSTLQEKFTQNGGYNIDTEINFVVSGLKINNEILNQKYILLSGGEKTLVQLAYLLLLKPNILLLDEPTNHLDMERIEWLEGYLLKFNGTIIVVSHDRYFLDVIATKILEIENGKATIFNGNYTYYTKEKEVLEFKAFENYKNQQKQVEAMEEAIKRLKEWGERGDNPTMFRRANAIQKRLNKMLETAYEKPKQLTSLPINFLRETRSGNECIELKNFSFSFKNKELFKNVNYKLFIKDKVALLGANGTGKTTLIKCILGENKDFCGTIKLGSNIQIGYFSQLLIFEDESLNVLNYYKQKTAENEQDARRNLTKFYFYKDSVLKKISMLSGGEKIRLKLAILLKEKINMLVFDEPTNHIDIFTKEVLEEALKNFNGPLLIVSHDRYFVNNIANKIIEIKNLNLVEYNGNYDYYKEKSKKTI